MSEKCLMKNLRFDVEISIYDGMFQAAGYEDNEDGHTKLIQDLLNARFENYIFDNVLFESPPLEINLVQINQFSQEVKWEEV